LDPWRKLIQVTWDVLSWVIAVPIAVFLRFDGVMPANYLGRALLLGLGLGLGQVVILSLVQRWKGRRIIGSFDEISAVTFSAGVVVIAGFLALLATSSFFLPRTVPLIAGAIALGLMLAGRFIFRLYRQRAAAPREGSPVIIYGAGESGEQIVRQMLASPDSGFIPVAMLDDNTQKHNLRIQGVRVVGTRDDLERVASAYGASVLVVAIAGIEAPALLALDRRCSAAGLTLRVIPTASEIIGGAVKLGDISEVTEEDLLGRRQIQTDEAGIEAFLKDKVILITGAGGSIGSEIARQVRRYSPARVALLDRDESALHGVQLSIEGRALLDSENLILADIRDAERVRDVLQQVRPDVVFHSAALKHLPLLERHPDEAQKTNVEGTRNVLAACAEVSVPVFVNISTDKAAEPTSVLGRTKLLTEQSTAEIGAQVIAGDGGVRYLSVRFGNVIGSRGSVISAFRHQIRNGGPITITDPEVTRYFMTVSEAVHLVLQAAVIGEAGETLVLDMGEPVRILDVAQEMIHRSGRDVDIVITGLRPGEKLHEDLIAKNERSERPKHPLIAHIRPE